MIGRRISALATAFAAVALFGVGGLVLTREGAEKFDPALRLFYNGLFLHVPLALVIFALALWGGNTRQRLGLGAGQIIVRTAPAAVFGFVALSMSARIAGEWSGASMDALEKMEAWIRGAWFSMPALTFLSISIIPGFVEELALRGYLLNALRSRLGATVALVLSSLLFGLLHLDPLYSTLAFFMGLYLGALALLTGGIWVPVLAHAFNNFMSLPETIWTTFGVNDLKEVGVAGEAGVFVAAALVSAACLAYCARTVREVRAERALEWGATGPDGMGPGQAPPGTAPVEPTRPGAPE